MSMRALAAGTFLCLGLAFGSAWAKPNRSGAYAYPTGRTAVDEARRLDAGEFNLLQNNRGALPLSTGYPGLVYPRGTSNSLVFAGGLWVGARVGGVTRVTVAEFTQEHAPGGIVGGVPEDPGAPRFLVYKVARFTGDPQDTSQSTRFRRWTPCRRPCPRTSGSSA